MANEEGFDIAVGFGENADGHTQLLLSGESSSQEPEVGGRREDGLKLLAKLAIHVKSMVRHGNSFAGLDSRGRRTQCFSCFFLLGKEKRGFQIPSLVNWVSTALRGEQRSDAAPSQEAQTQTRPSKHQRSHVHNASEQLVLCRKYGGASSGAMGYA